MVPLKKHPRLIYAVQPHSGQIDAAMQDFHQTVELIEAECQKPYSQQWLAPAHVVEEQTCEACDLRYNCAAFTAGARLRQQAL